MVGGRLLQSQVLVVILALCFNSQHKSELFLHGHSLFTYGKEAAEAWLIKSGR